MNRTEKLEAINAKYVANITEKTNDVLSKQQNVNEKIAVLRALENEHEAKKAAVNKYYDAIDEIARLQAIIDQEPQI